MRATFSRNVQLGQASSQAVHTGPGMNARVLQPGDADYPSRLLELAHPPDPLFLRGTLTTANAPAVAIVGTRNASGYGLSVARAIATACARAGVAVVSGLARGIDGASHEATLTAGGRTVGVLGTGLDVVFPKTHRALQERVGRDGLLVSELPADSTGHGGSFPQRNRIIAALADVVVVVEAPESSGALITARLATELNRTVAAVPNAIGVASSAGSNALLKDGAEPILHPDDVLDLLQVRALPTPAPALDGDAAACWDAVMQGATDVGAIARASGLSQRATAGAVAMLEIEGLLTVDLLGFIRPSPGLQPPRARL